MNYRETLTYLYESVPMFQQIGGDAYKPGLETTHRLDRYFGHPHRKFRTIHIAGTNGKGSCSHTLAAVLQKAGYRTGLFTSPHLVDFRERIRIDGEMMPQEYVVSFVEEHRSFFEPLHPSFFELTTAMAFRYFADEGVDVAVIETGMGGRLDCTNIIRPDLCLITNIGFDHTAYLGDTLPRIAAEKAGIIKEGVPTVVGRAEGEVRQVFERKAAETGAPIFFAADERDRYTIGRRKVQGREMTVLTGGEFPDGLFGELSGACQEENILTLVTALRVLRGCGEGYAFTADQCRDAFARVCSLTGLMGRWQTLRERPTLICDTGHNADGIAHICTQLEEMRRERNCGLHFVFGMVNDKDVRSVLALLPKDAAYYFTQASVKRALPAEELMRRASEAGLRGTCHSTVTEAVRTALKKSLPEDIVFAGGSSFIVADLLASRDTFDFH